MLVVGGRYLTDETLTHIANAEVVYGEVCCKCRCISDSGGKGGTHTCGASSACSSLKVPITANNKLAQLQRSHMFMPQGITLKEMIGDSLWMQVGHIRPLGPNNQYSK